ncbi:hypothetical protein, conserved [Thermococcus kodakarensis KOD1]|uniref:Uncharacterized protein n=1 Tax=Thermococcus kodakarensis (strain ATCC BAA-918 / JCM 12380 / KOD1) TaxID=69014 RepID=Q5JES2_THEKO|nr:hypothetical protein [Thermococcus kodakarensis]WCN27805.1 hypothetical protein POG15_09740 [Thermococcus kodakarensis]WCN30101.1 hypothetical protein POG21_09725 [Thermococcus kodakarensis]BAD86100.1 hypothetical protein, conserved [Thermococcus kodakarensis KOD1]
MTDKKKLVKEAYSFGYFLGLKGHSEWVEWVRKKREELYKQAEELGIYDLVKEAYKKGKEQGLRDRSEMIAKNLIVAGKIEPEGTSKKVEVAFSPEESREEVLESGKSLEREYFEFLQTTNLMLPPELLDSVKALEPPKMLRLRGSEG